MTQQNVIVNYLNIAKQHFQLNKFDEAYSVLLNALKLYPENADLLHCMGLLMAHLKFAEKAVFYFEQAIRSNPNHVFALADLGAVLTFLGYYPRALKLTQKALKINPDHYNAIYNKLLILNRTGRSNEAMKIIKDNLSANAKLSPEFIYTYASTLYMETQITEALTVIESAIPLFPDFTKFRLFRGELLLLLGDLKRGFIEMKDQYQVLLLRSYPPLDTPTWQGEPLENKTLLVRNDCGLGDTIQFMRYISRLLSRNCTIIVDMPSCLHCLFQNLGFSLINHNQSIPPHDMRVHLLSLPGILQTDNSSIPAPFSFPFVCHKPIKNRIGLAWKGSRVTSHNHKRSIELPILLPLLEIQDLHYVSLQKDPTPEEVSFLKQTNVEMPNLDSWTATVEVLETCERVITVDTAVAHMAGTMGIPTWMFTHFTSEWRWMLKRTDSPWYPSVVLFRQTQLNSWKEPIENIRRELQQLTSY